MIDSLVLTLPKSRIPKTYSAKKRMINTWLECDGVNKFWVEHRKLVPKYLGNLVYCHLVMNGKLKYRCRLMIDQNVTLDLSSWRKVHKSIECKVAFMLYDFQLLKEETPFPNFVGYKYMDSETQIVYK